MFSANGIFLNYCIACYCYQLFPSPLPPVIGLYSFHALKSTFHKNLTLLIYIILHLSKMYSLHPGTLSSKGGK